MTEKETLLLCAFARYDRPDTDIRSLVTRFGSVTAVFAAKAVMLRHMGVRGRDAEAIVGCRQADLAEEQASLHRTGVTALPWTDPRYPAALCAIIDAPPVLFVRGDISALSSPAVAVVGSRRTTRYGLDAARDIATSLARAGAAVVSGLAFGIDAAAHAASVDAGGRTVAALASGVDAGSVGPRANAGLAERMIAAGGALVSEHPPGTEGSKPRFPRRNRIIAALSSGTVVVQAPVRSGALITAKAALEYGKDVFAVPGRIDDPAAAGSNALIAAGAIPLCTPDDAAAYYGLRAPGKDAAPLTPDEKAVLDAIAAAPTTIDGIIAVTGLSPERALALVGGLELAGAVLASGGAYRRIDNGPASPLP